MNMGSVPDLEIPEEAERSRHNNPLWFCTTKSPFLRELTGSAEILFRPKSCWLLLLGLTAVVGDATGLLGEAACFALSGLALIPCAERLSFVTEQVAEHTNGTIGALLNATFGNAPELLIAFAALKSGYYRVVQLAMLGSMLTNMILVFGISCIIGGCRWQVQNLRITSGNVFVAMLYVSTAGSLFPAALILSQQLPYDIKQPNIPTIVEVVFCRVNASVMMILYVLFLVFQLGTHKDEFDDNQEFDDADEDIMFDLSRRSTRTQNIDNDRHMRHRAQRNLFCLNQMSRVRNIMGGGAGARAGFVAVATSEDNDAAPMVMKPDSERLRTPKERRREHARACSSSDIHTEALKRKKGEACEKDGDDDDNGDLNSCLSDTLIGSTEARTWEKSVSDLVCNSPNRRRNAHRPEGIDILTINTTTNNSSHKRLSLAFPTLEKSKVKGSEEIDDIIFLDADDDDDDDALQENDVEAALLSSQTLLYPPHDGPLLSLRVGVAWLFIITLCISALSDILVDTIDGFARQLRLSEVFTSMVVVPFFSNVAEQVSSFLFAYRNEMDLVVGVTIGSAIQIATFVLPGSVLIGMFLDRSMTLYFRGFETVCIFFGVVVVGSILQGGTTNWLVGAILVGIYIIMAAGIWFHELEDLTVDGETAILRNNNETLRF